VWQLYAIFLAECRNIFVVLLRQRVTVVKFDHPLRGDATNWAIVDHAVASQRFRRIHDTHFWRTVDTIPAFVPRDYVHVDFPAFVVRQNEVKGSLDLTFGPLISSRCRELARVGTVDDLRLQCLSPCETAFADPTRHRHPIRRRSRRKFQDRPRSYRSQSHPQMSCCCLSMSEIALISPVNIRRADLSSVVHCEALIDGV
jgi:hypothetical protein